MKAADVAKQLKAPPRTVVLKPEDWCWKDAPACEIAVGLRNISDADESQAREEAAKRLRETLESTEDPDVYVEEYNAELVARIVGFHLCDPNDCASDPEEIPSPDEYIRLRLTSKAIRRLWEEVEKMRVETSPLYREASDADLDSLADAICSGKLDFLSPEELNIARRHAAFILDLFNG